MRLMVAGLFVSAAVLGACSANDDDGTDNAVETVAVPSTEEVTGTESPATSAEFDEDVFIFADDDLCEWVTGEQVAAMVSAVFEWDGTVADAVPAPRASCEWRLANGAGYLLAGDASQWVDFSGEPYDVAAAGPVVEYSEDDPPYLQIGTTVTGHPALSDGVVVRNDGFGQYAFWVPPDTQYLSYSLELQGVEVEDMFDEDQFFVVADEFLRELGWVAASK